MAYEDWKRLEKMRQATGAEFQRWEPDRDVTMKLVLEPWTSSDYAEWVRAEDAIRREAELLDVIRELEERATRSADLLAKAVGMLEGVAPQKAG